MQKEITKNNYLDLTTEDFEKNTIAYWDTISMNTIRVYKPAELLLALVHYHTYPIKIFMFDNVDEYKNWANRS